MRLNLGCGADRRDGYVNVDLRADVADHVGDVARLDWLDDGTVDEILALDILEHFPAARTADVLAEWRRVLDFDGTLIVRVPNLHMICSLIVEGRMLEALIRNLYGGHRWGPEGAWDSHHTGWVPAMLEAELVKAGFAVESNDGELNMLVVARRVG